MSVIVQGSSGSVGSEKVTIDGEKVKKRINLVNNGLIAQSSKNPYSSVSGHLKFGTGMIIVDNKLHIIGHYDVDDNDETTHKSHYISELNVEKGSIWGYVHYNSTYSGYFMNDQALDSTIDSIEISGEYHNLESCPKTSYPALMVEEYNGSSIIHLFGGFYSNSETFIGDHYIYYKPQGSNEYKWEHMDTNDIYKRCNVISHNGKYYLVNDGIFKIYERNTETGLYVWNDVLCDNANMSKVFNRRTTHYFPIRCASDGEYIYLFDYGAECNCIKWKEGDPTWTIEASTPILSYGAFILHNKLCVVGSDGKYYSHEYTDDGSRWNYEGNIIKDTPYFSYSYNTFSYPEYDTNIAIDNIINHGDEIYANIRIRNNVNTTEFSDSYIIASGLHRFKLTHSYCRGDK